MVPPLASQAEGPEFDPLYPPTPAKSHQILKSTVNANGSIFCNGYFELFSCFDMLFVICFKIHFR